MYPTTRRVALGLFLSAVLLLPIVSSAGTQEPVVVKNGGDYLSFEPQIEAEDMILTVTGPCNYKIRRSLREDGELFFKLDETTIDGMFRFEVTVIPYIDGSVLDVLADARKTGDNSGVDKLCREGALPGDPTVQSAGFRVYNATILYDPEKQEDFGISQPKLADHDLPSLNKDQVILDDLIVDGSACIGFDCVNGESFGFDTLRLKENNLRIKFEDTSVGSFPTADWQLTANDSASGGLSKFSIDDISGGRTPFTVEANTPSHTLYVDNGGRIGSGTSSPVADLHVKDGDSPTLRLEQDTSAGFAPQTWDLAGNETNFFIRDATNGSQLPFRIRPGADSNSIYIENDNNVGFGTTAADERLHVVGADNPRLLIQDTANNANNKPGLALDSPAAASDGLWVFEVDNAGNFQIDFGPSAGPEIVITDNTATNGTVTINGNLMVNGTCTGCDEVFQPDFPLPSLDEQAAFMYENSYLPAVGPTPEGKGLINVFAKTTGMLQELEKAHIYIDQLHKRLAALEAKLDAAEEADGN